MAGFTLYILTALSLILVIEGLLYALFPDLMRRIMATAIMLPVPRLRLFGAIMALSGFCMVLLFI
jgi:uncharacterized protein YjeT (DUF2065 family)